MTDFRALFQALTHGGVEFVLIGGVAAVAHGSSRFTADLDIVYRRAPENHERLARALEPLRPALRGAPPGLPFRFDAATIRSGLNFTMETTLGSLDLLGEAAGSGTYESLLPDSEAIEWFGSPVRVVSLQRLVGAEASRRTSEGPGSDREVGSNRRRAGLSGYPRRRVSAPTR